MTNLDVVMKLIGNTSPVGETNVDSKRLENFKELMHLTEGLIRKIEQELRNQESYEYSVKLVGTKAKTWMEQIGYTYFRSHLTIVEPDTTASQPVDPECGAG